ncbi:Uncharacterized protein PECH_002132 [Penicillium ucsense]|uniref:Uncharacterized protein n=1 Tax=Penicillium ucsense TaxID=2839758 RepID=A0A8J8WJ84_9EURO|nr:Uncharacterized protein PECM_007180 [Penicillium ucsense]KAF7738086.1 Uncharacterized protein PECH_002132 [Penicillium ucsense]
MAPERPLSSSPSTPSTMELIRTSENAEMSEHNEYVAIQPSDFANKAESISRSIKQTQQLQASALELSKPARVNSSTTSGLGSELLSLPVIFSLVTVITHLANDNPEGAKSVALQSLHKARALNNQYLIARCQYWMGRVELEFKRPKVAHELFTSARACLMNDDTLESETVQFYIEMSKRLQCKRQEIGERQQDRESPRARKNENSTKRTRQYSPLHKKRKREFLPWKVVLRPAPENKFKGHSQRSTPTNPRKAPARINEWIVRDMPDLSLPSRETDIDHGSNDVHSDRLSEEATRCGPLGPKPTLQADFTMRCFPVGIAPRTRPTNIFPKLPMENLLSPPEWESLKNAMSKRAVTMA